MTISLPALDLFQDIEFDNQLQRTSKYTDTEKLNAAVIYLSFGNLNKTAQATNIPQRTLYDWSKSDWWDKLCTRIRQEKRTEFDAGFTRIIDKAINHIENQLDSGNVSARDAATIMGITFDKRQVLNMQPTSITKSLNINDLHEQFERFMNAKTIDSELVDE